MEFFTVSLLALATVAVSVTIHYETLRALSRLAHSPGTHRWLVLWSMFSALISHTLQIWIFAGAYVLAERLDLGQILTTSTFMDYLYYSAMVYTTVGFGDVIPDGPLRMITNAEALSGLALITWSASFTYLQMQRLWRD